MTEEIIARLRSLDLSDGGSHSRLSAIASCFYQPTFGWTRGACETLRDKLIETMEGKYGNDDNDNFDDCDCTHHRCDQHGRQVSYDELDNERHKAIAGLRKVCTKLDESVWTWIEDVAIAIGALDKQSDKYESMLPKITDRLIHLLGGDQPTLSDLYGIWQDGAESENKGSESAHKMTKSVEIGELDVDSTSYQSHESSPMRQENETRITDELRKWASDNTIKDMVLTTYPEQHGVHGILEQLIAIADRIDTQFDRICEQQEKVLQQTIDEMTEFHEHDAEYALTERDELQEKCDRLKAKVEHQREQLAVYATMYDFDAIRALKRERNEHKHRADNAEGHVKSLERRLDAAHETYCALLNDATREFRALTEERDELQAKLDDYDKTHVELPKDENDEYIHIGDMMDGYAKTIEIVELRYGRSGWMLISRDGNGYADTFAFAHHHAPTIEQVIRELTLGKITEAQAIERIEVIHG